MFETILLVSGAVFLSGLTFFVLRFLYRYAKYRYLFHVASEAGVFSHGPMDVNSAAGPMGAYLQLQEMHDDVRRVFNRPKPVATTCSRCRKKMKNMNQTEE